MATPEVVSAIAREGKFNKNAARRVRVAGKIPAVIYGSKEPAQAIEVDPKQIQRILWSEAGHNSIFDLELGGALTKVMIVDWQYEPIKSKLLHIDLKRIAMDKLMRVEVPITLVGVPIGVRAEGGMLDHILREVEIECLPADIPSHIDVDVSGLSIGQGIHVSDLPHGSLKFITDEDATVAHVIAIKEEVVATPDAAAVAAATPAEPEVVKKGKQDADAAAAEPAKGAKK
jgi:large subunit ribosomal protein L25